MKKKKVKRNKGDGQNTTKLTKLYTIIYIYIHLFTLVTKSVYKKSKDVCMYIQCFLFNFCVTAQAQRK